MTLLGSIMGFVCAGVGVYLIKEPIKELKKMNRLIENGKLIKGLPYKLEGTNLYSNGVQQERIVTSYTLPNGVTQEFKSIPRVVKDGNDYSFYFE